MKKHIVALMLVLSFGLLNCSNSIASPIAYTVNEPRPIEIIANGKFIQLDVYPLMDKNRLSIPIRALASLGLSYSFNPSTKITTVQNKDGDYIKISINSTTAYKNENPIQMGIPAQNKNGRVLVPIRFISESLGYNVQFESFRKFVFINSKDYSFDPNLLNQDDLQAARKVAIALPITTDFKTLDARPIHDHDYSFPAGRADTYYFHTNSNQIFTFVQIQNGKAIAIGQLDTDGFTRTAGNVLPNLPFDDNPIFEPFNHGNVLFFENGDGTAIAAFNDVRLKTKINVYSDIIQKLPDHI